jgi:hypothetical protein
MSDPTDVVLRRETGFLLSIQTTKRGTARSSRPMPVAINRR